MMMINGLSHKGMNFYEIRIRATGELKTATAPTFAKACEMLGYRPKQCHLVWRAGAENACDPANY